jgi:4-hydroxy-3-polyprenylbenzoate decarboxylase
MIEYREPPERPRQIVVGISGASGIAFGVRTLELTRKAGVETHLVISKSAALTIAHESDLSIEQIHSLADHSHRAANVGAAIASGSFPTDGMIVAPCATKTLSAVAHGMSDNLLTRAAEVTLKERRRLVLMVRETPLTLAHLRAMTAITEMGGIVMPPVPALYLRPETIDDLVTHTAGRALDLLGIEVPDLDRWSGI